MPANAGDKGFCLTAAADTDGVGFYGASVADVDIATPCAVKLAGGKAHGDVGVASAVALKRLSPNGRVVAAGGVAKKGKSADGRVGVAGGASLAFGRSRLQE